MKSPTDSDNGIAAAEAPELPFFERGFISIEFVMAVGLSLLTFVFLTNFVVYQFGKGMVRAAVNEGARAGARAAGTDDICVAKVNQVLGSNFLDGPMWADHQAVTCSLVNGREVAEIHGHFAGWFPEVPNLGVDVTASALKETDVAP